ncbi:MAG: MarR family transcriptional regulator, partial [Thermomicrobiales bacterium]
RSMGELASGLAVSLPSASELVDRLIERGLVEKSVDPSDRRRVLVALTEPAIGYGRRIHDLRREQAQAALASIPPDERECFLRSIRALAAVFDPGIVTNSPTPT